MGKYSDMFNEEVGHLRHDRETQEEQAKQKEREAARPLLEKVMPFLSAAKTDLEESGITIDFNPRWDRPRDELQYLAFQLQLTDKSIKGSVFRFTLQQNNGSFFAHRQSPREKQDKLLLEAKNIGEVTEDQIASVIREAVVEFAALSI